MSRSPKVAADALRPRAARFRFHRQLNIARAAAAWIDAGHGVFLLESGAKRPLGLLHRRGHRDATLEVARFRGWLGRHPQANYGIVPSAGTLVLDVDPRSGGLESLQELEAKHGRLPKTTQVLSGKHGESRGYHLWFSSTNLSAGKGQLAPGIEWKVGASGYLVGPGSRHPSGVTYELVGAATEVAEAPDWLIALVQPPRPERNETPRAKAHWRVPVGDRHNRLVGIAGALCRQGYTTEDEIAEALGALAWRFDDPDGEVQREIRRTARDAATRWGGEISAFESQVARVMERLLAQEEARRRIEAGRAQALPLPPAGETLEHDLAEPPREVEFTIERLHRAGANTLLVAPFKVGKTTLLFNLLRALADHEPFLDHFEVAEVAGRIAYLNYELDADQFRKWAHEVDIKHPERIARPIHLRGVALPFWRPEIGDQLSKWLRANEVEVLIIDPAARAWLGSVDNENDNAKVGAFTDALDVLKRSSDVRDLFLATHTGRQQPEEGKERSRGATRLEDWMDSGWYLTRGGSAGQRSLRALGRDVELEAIDLTYRDHDRRLIATGQTREERREQDGIQRAVDALAQVGEGCATNELEKAMGGPKEQRGRWIRSAARQGYIERREPDNSVHDEHSPSRGGRRLACHLTEQGEKLHSRRLTLPSAQTSEE